MFSICFLICVYAVFACPFAKLFKGGAAGNAMAAAHAKAGVRAPVKAAAATVRELNVHEKRAQKQPIDIQDTFILTSRVKTPASLVFGQGFPVGFAVNGFETPQLTLLVGKVYNFTVLSGCTHQFYLSNDPRGRGRLPITDGWVDEFGNAVTPPNNSTNQICDGASILWNATFESIGQLVTYQCFVHDNMGFTLNVQGESICDSNTDRLSDTVLNSAGLVGQLINNLLATLTINSKSNIIIDYWDGSIGQPLNLTDRKTNGAALASIQQNFVAFFGEVLGCTDNSIPPYTGPSMDQIHAGMPIGNTEYGAFVTAFVGAMQSLNFPKADIDTVTSELNSNQLKAGVCNFQADCLTSLCNQYSATNASGVLLPNANLNLVQAIVDTLFASIAADSELSPFFNGMTPPGSANIVGSSSALDELKQEFIAFLGLPIVLACTDPTFPNTTITSLTDLQATHANIPIDLLAFTQFVNLFEQALTSSTGGKFTQADAATATAIINSTLPFLCNQPGCPGSAASDPDATIFVIGVAPKQASNLWPNQGFASGYTLNGQFNQGLTLVVGQQYVFQGNTSCFHPFYLTTGFGAGSTEVTEGVLQGVGQNTCLGKNTVFQPTADQVGQQIFYQCRNHQFMGGLICVVSDESQMSQACVFNTAAPQPGSLFSPCDDLTQAVKAKAPQFTTSFGILQQAMRDVFAKVASSASQFPHFDATFEAQLSTHVDSFATFFANDIGCSDTSFTKYSATFLAPDMKAVHAGLNIESAEFSAFNQLILNEFTNFNGTGAGMSSQNLAKVTSFLAATSPDICSDCQGSVSQTLCEKWALNTATFSNDQNKLVTAIVTKTFTSFIADTTNVVYFNGTDPCNSRDFINNAINQEVLVQQLTAFFGSAGVLGCTQPDFPQYTGQTDMGALHAHMPIDFRAFNAFNQALLGAISSVVGALSSDIASINALLASPGITVICNAGSSCPAPQGKWVQLCATDFIPVPAQSSSPPPPPPPSVGGSASAVAVAVGALVVGALAVL